MTAALVALVVCFVVQCQLTMAALAVLLVLSSVLTHNICSSGSSGSFSILLLIAKAVSLHAAVLSTNFFAMM